MPKYGMNSDLKSILCHSTIFSTLNRQSFKNWINIYVLHAK